MTVSAASANDLVDLVRLFAGYLRFYQVPRAESDIADFLGLTIETVSRTLTRLRKQDIIALETSQTVLIKDMDALISASQAAD